MKKWSKDGTSVTVSAKEWDQILAVVEAAKDAERSIGRVYMGYPGKIQWPEWHTLRQSLEELQKN